MAAEKNSNATDTLSADIKALQDRVEKLTDKLNDTQREVVQLRTEVVGQDKRLSDTVGRFGDVNTWLDGFAIFITLLIAVAGIFGFWQASRRAADEARHWLKKNGRELLNELKDDVEQHKAVIGQSLDKLAAHMAAAPLTKLPGPLYELDEEKLQQADVEIRKKPESDYSTDDLSMLGHAAYRFGRKKDAIFYWSKLVNRKDATEFEVALSLCYQGYVYGEMGEYNESFALYDQLISRFREGKDIDIAALVSFASYNKGVKLASFAPLRPLSFTGRN